MFRRIAFSLGHFPDNLSIQAGGCANLVGAIIGPIVTDGRLLRAAHGCGEFRRSPQLVHFPKIVFVSGAILLRWRAEREPGRDCKGWSLAVGDSEIALCRITGVYTMAERPGDEM